MNDDSGFLKAIRENPNDEIHRLIYADWLEERGDPRGEYLRLECEVARIQRRLNELRPQIEMHWIGEVLNHWAVVLVSYTIENKIEIIRRIRQFTGMGLKEAKDVAEALPACALRALKREQAEVIARQFEPFAVVEIRPCPIVNHTDPMRWLDDHIARLCE